MSQSVIVAFTKADANKDGTLSAEELGNVIRQLNPNFSDDEVEQLLAAADGNSDGVISYEEFVRWLFGGGGDVALEDWLENNDDWKGNEEDTKAQWDRTKDELLGWLGEIGERPEEDESFPNDLSTACGDFPQMWVPAQLGPALSGVASSPSWAKLFQSISPNCLQQGSLGDCWLLAAISALCEYPQLIYDCFPGQSGIAEDGMYRVRLFDPCDYSEHIVEVSDMVPFFARRPSDEAFWKPVYVRPTGNEIFVPILEKACAKFLHSGRGGGTPTGWEALSGGGMFYGWAMLTGVQESWKYLKKHGEEIWQASQVAEFKTKSGLTSWTRDQFDNDAMWQKMVELDEQGAMMGCSMTGGRENQMEDGLVTGHAYSVVSVKETAGRKMVQCRNPWGSAKEWNGELSDTSGFWETAEGQNVATEIKYVANAGDGLFWMPWENWSERWEKIFVTLTSARRRDFSVEFSEKFMKMVARRKAGTFDGPTDIEIATLRYCWDSYAEPLGGFIDRQQLLVLLKILNMPPANEEDDLDDTYAEFDSDDDGQVGWSDFFNEMMARAQDPNCFP